MKLICIGDSIVDGFPFERDVSFPAVIKSKTGWDVLNKGISGQSSADINIRFGYEADAGADIILILCGANDYIFDICGVDETVENIRSMAAYASKKNIRTAVCSPPLCRPAQAAVCWADCDISAYEHVNSQLKDLSCRLSSLFDMNKIENSRFIDVQELYADYAKYHDGVHPTVEGYRLIGEYIAAELTAK